VSHHNAAFFPRAKLNKHFGIDVREQ